MQGKVSVVIPTYKRYRDKVDKAIQSVLKQSYNDIEIIIVDDNDDNKYSQDIEKYLRDYPEIIYVTHSSNKELVPLEIQE